LSADSAPRPPGRVRDLSRHHNGGGPRVSRWTPVRARLDSRRGPTGDHQVGRHPFLLACRMPALYWRPSRRSTTTSSAGWVTRRTAFKRRRVHQLVRLGLTAGAGLDLPLTGGTSSPRSPPTPPPSWANLKARSHRHHQRQPRCLQVASAHAEIVMRTAFRPRHPCLGGGRTCHRLARVQGHRPKPEGRRSGPPSLSASGTAGPNDNAPGRFHDRTRRRPGPQALSYVAPRVDPRDRVAASAHEQGRRPVGSNCTVSSEDSLRLRHEQLDIWDPSGVRHEDHCGAQGRVAERYRGAFRWSVGQALLELRCDVLTRCTRERTRRTRSPTISMSCPITPLRDGRDGRDAHVGDRDPGESCGRATATRDPRGARYAGQFTHGDGQRVIPDRACVDNRRSWGRAGLRFR